ncbi:metal-dependent hydrolase [Pedobacter arcticus]|uniref:metal-dependent hydrolase n=1 Tax=Pedobacter arcticus TaxID=752140 RepID=UPI00031940C3|nr:metal-dependent hydrolase [Pedobacter arcticus]
MMKLNYFGQSCFLLEVNGTKILFDPFITPNELAKDIDVEQIDCDYILVSHGHEDHVADLVSIAKRTKAKIISSFEIIEWLKKQGIDNGHPMNLGGNWNFDFGKVKMMYAAHSNSLPDGSYGGTAAGFIIQTGKKTLYYAGDTALNQDMKLTGELFAIDYAFLPIGDNFTMGITDAIIAADFIKCKNIIAMHYDTFGYIKVDHEQAKKAFADAGIELSMLKISDKEVDAKVL